MPLTRYGRVRESFLHSAGKLPTGPTDKISVTAGQANRSYPAASSDPAPNEFTDGRRFGQDNARIDIRGIAFAPGDNAADRRVI